MANTQEKHFTSQDIVKDIVIGMSDGLTVPFALAAGLSGAVDTTQIILTAGLAEIAAGSIAMGLGGYLSGKTLYEHYQAELRREREEIINVPETEKKEVVELLETYGLDSQDAKNVAENLSKNPEKWADFMMRFELGLECPNPKRALISAFAIGSSYIVGGMVPLFPYWFAPTAKIGLQNSAIVTLIALAIFGYWKGKITGASAWKSLIQTCIIGSLAALTAYGVASALG